MRGDVGDAGEEVGGEAGQVALRELAGWEDLQNVGRLRGGEKRAGVRRGSPDGSEMGRSGGRWARYGS